MTTDRDIDYSKFGPAKIKTAVDAIRSRPNLTRNGVRKLEQDKDMLTARFDEVTTIREPLEEAYVSARRRVDINYDPDKDKKLREVNKAAGERYEQLLTQLEPLRETWLKVAAAKEAQYYLLSVLDECLKICDILVTLRDAERGNKTATADALRSCD